MAYAEKRAANPGALGLTIGLNAAAVLALALWNPNMFHIPKDPWTTIHVGPPPPLPPPPPETKRQVKQTIDQPQRTVGGGATETWHPTDPDPGSIDLGGGGIGTGTGTVIEPPPQPPIIDIVRRAPTMSTAAGDLQPPYPPGLQRLGIAGSVTVRILVGTDGRPKDIVLVRADDPGFFAAARTWGLRHWRFRPAAEDDRAVEGWYTLTVRFTIE